MSFKQRLKDFRAFGAEAMRQTLETPLYNTGIALYSGGIKIAAGFNPKAARLVEGHRHIHEALDKAIDPSRKYVWVHAASLGEFEQGRPIIERIKRNHLEMGVVLTFFSPSGYEVRKNYNGADVVCYMPFDTRHNMRKFLYKVNPEMAVFVKYEIWRNALRELYRRSIPTYLVSAVFRPDQIFFKKTGSWYRSWLSWYTHIFVQDERSRDLLGNAGISNVTVCGDTRFDRVADICAAAKSIPELDAFVGRKGDPSHSSPVMVSGSSWPKDEEVYAGWLNDHPEVKAIVAPHEFDAERLSRLKSLFTNGAVLLSELKDSSASADGRQVIIIDCFGLLSSAYAYGDFAYIGGGFGVGIHNLNEAATFGIPVVFGPNHEKFIEAIDLKTLGGGLAVDSRSSFERVADRLLHDEADRLRRGRWAREYIEEKTGASDKIYNAIFR